MTQAKRSVLSRYIELPRFLRAVPDRAELARTLDDVARSLAFRKLCFVSGPSVTSELAVDLATALNRVEVSHLVVEDNGVEDVEQLATAANLLNADVAVAVGGGRTIDVVKLACERADRPLVSIPTQLAADGIASPISVIRDANGHTSSHRARLPLAVLADLSAIATSPVESVRAGLGDLLANRSALRDWRLAEMAGREIVDDFAALLAQTATDLVYATDITALGRGEPSEDLLGRLLEGLVLSGLAMEIAGSSRPCSGSEHLFSHALDELRPDIALHGEQVAFGAVIATRLQDHDWQSLAEFLRSAGMESATTGFGLTGEELTEALEAAPSTRPDRYTVLDTVDQAQLREALHDVLG